MMTDTKSINIDDKSNRIFLGIEHLIETTSKQVAISLNVEVSRLYWSIGNYIISQIQYETYSQYGRQILATVSQQLIAKFGKGYTYSALTRMVKISREYHNVEMFATLSQTLSWSHFIELVSIEDETKRLFYQQMAITEKWSIRVLRSKIDSMLFEKTAIAAKPNNEILSTLQTIDTSNINPDLIFRNTYVLDFLGLGDYYSDKRA